MILIKKFKDYSDLRVMLRKGGVVKYEEPADPMKVLPEVEVVAPRKNKAKTVKSPTINPSPVSAINMLPNVTVTPNTISELPETEMPSYTNMPIDSYIDAATYNPYALTALKLLGAQDNNSEALLSMIAAKIGELQKQQKRNGKTNQ